MPAVKSIMKVDELFVVLHACHPPAAAAMDRESLPPSTATSSSIIASRSATAASYMAAPSLSILAAYIQLTAAEARGNTG